MEEATAEESTATAKTGTTCPSASASDDEVLRAWFQLYSGMQNVTADVLAEVERSVGLAAPEFQVLSHLHQLPGRRAPMNEISRLLNFSTAGTTKLIDRLAAMGLVERHTSPADRRVILAELTEAGESAGARGAGVLANALRERIIGRLGPQRMTGLLEAFEMLAAESGEC